MGMCNAHSRLRALTKYRKNEAFIRNDGVYVISGIFCGAHEGRAQCAKQAEVSPVSNESCKRACERCRSTIANCGCKCLHLRRKIHSRPDCWPSKPAKRCVDKQSGNLARKPQVCGRSEPRMGMCNAYSRLFLFFTPGGPAAPASLHRAKARPSYSAQIRPGTIRPSASPRARWSRQCAA